MIQADYCRLWSSSETVTQAITKPMSCHTVDFADKNTGVSWLHLFLECIYLFNSLQAGCAIRFFWLPTLPVSCVCWVRNSRKTHESLICRLEIIKLWKANKKNIIFFHPFFFFSAHEGLAAVSTLLSSAVGQVIRLAKCTGSSFPTLFYHYHYRPQCNFIMLHHRSVESLEPRLSKLTKNNKCLNLFFTSAEKL